MLSCIWLWNFSLNVDVLVQYESLVRKHKVKAVTRQNDESHELTNDVYDWPTWGGLIVRLRFFEETSSELFCVWQLLKAMYNKCFSEKTTNLKFQNKCSKTASCIGLFKSAHITGTKNCFYKDAVECFKRLLKQILCDLDGHLNRRRGYGVKWQREQPEFHPNLM